MDLEKKLYAYVEEFNRNDEECHPCDISNEQAFEFLKREIPLIDLPDKTMERTYYFRWWTYRKHLRQTPYGVIITEFLPDVPWAGSFNSINCAFPLHMREGRWLKNAKLYLRDYALFFLKGYGQAFAYSMSLVTALREYARVTGDTAFLTENYELIRDWFEQRNARAAAGGGLFFSDDDRDGMEYSISGPGLRPTVNSYVYGDAAALSEISALAGRKEEAQSYAEFAARLAEAVNRYLYDGSFYRTIPAGEEEEVILHGGKVSAEHDCRELIGYLPWLYGLADEQKNGAWKALFQEDGFACRAGLTTAERRHPRFMEEHDHECLWNGPVWPFAVSQTLAALAEAGKRFGKLPVTEDEYCGLLHQYALCHKRTREDGKTVDWIDENLDPFTGEWLSRKILEAGGFPETMGGYERGKDYNHSLFCDLVLGGLLGLEEGADGELTVSPRIPDSWEYFRVENLNFHEDRYTVVYDRNSTGLTVSRRERS